MSPFIQIPANLPTCRNTRRISSCWKRESWTMKSCYRIEDNAKRPSTSGSGSKECWVLNDPRLLAVVRILDDWQWFERQTSSTFGSG
ncbi:hypothetical protein CDAR_301381 [Caerostris darwini]|uniref:Uncharacterized protein n=1 Tax=Caerostris darwini TaxID=1538125 RepID=A0AAV4W0Z2_9ARAC|nr:hypothetical protein CDAR_301381 [Caerostris darwini]